MNTLTLKKSDFYVSVSRFLGWGDGPDNGDRKWTDKQLRILKDCVDSGCRNFYWPPPHPQGGSETYRWTFLTPTGQVSVPTESDASLVPRVLMPEDFGGFLSRLTVASTGGIYIPIDVVNEARLRELYARNPSTTGRPLFAAERPLKGTTNEHGPKRELIIYPRPDREYTFQFQYSLLPACLSDSYPYAYGGQEHSETIMESCIRIAEERYDDLVDGPHSRKFFELLAGSISRDRSHKPQVIGYNADHSDSFERSRLSFADYWQPVTLNGVPMGDY